MLICNFEWPGRARREAGPLSISNPLPAIDTFSPGLARVEPRPPWTVGYGQEFWRPRSRAGEIDVPRIIERVSHAFQRDAKLNTTQVVAHAYTATFDGPKARFAPNGEASCEAFLQTVSITRGSERLLAREDARPPSDWWVHGNTAQKLLSQTYDVVEHYEARQEGLELSWVLNRAPGGSGPLRVEVDINGLTYHSTTETGHHFADGEGVARMRIGAVTVVDAGGRRSAANSELRDQGLLIEVSEEVLAQAQFPLAIDPLISPEFGIDEPVPGLAGGHQSAPAVASNGRDYLVVWQSSVPDGYWKIRGARVRGDGMVLDVGGLPISTANMYQDYAVVASDGTDYFVAWRDNRHIQQGYTDVYGTKVTSEGRIVDPEGVAICNHCSAAPALASNGSNYFAVWTDRSVMGTFIDRDGVVLQPNGFVIASASPSKYEAEVASDGQNYLAVWTQQSATRVDVYGARVTSTGQVLDPEGFPISTAPSSQEQISAAGNSDGFLVTWTDSRNAQYDVFAARVNSSGQVLDPNGLAIYAGPRNQFQAAVTARAGEFQIIFRDQDGSLNYARVTSEGDLLDPIPQRLATGQSYHGGTAIASREEQTLVVWESINPELYAGSDIFGVRIGTDGIASDPRGFPVTLGRNAQNAPAIAVNDRNYLIVWQDGRGERPWNIYGARAGADGTILDVNGLAISTGPGDQEFPAVASNGRDFLVVWRDTRDRNTRGYDIYGCRVTGEGAVMDTNGIPLATTAAWEESPAVAGNENGYVMVWQGDVCCGTPLLAAHVSNEGVRAAEPARLDQNSIRPAIASNGRDFFAVWEAVHPPATAWSIFGARFSGTGALLDPIPLPIHTQAYHHRTAAIASDGQNYLVVWEAFDIFGAFVSSEGSASPSFPIMQDGHSQTRPEVVFDGREYLVAWADDRNAGHSGIDIYGAKVATGGVVFPSGGFVINAALGDQTRPAAAALNGTVLAVCQSPLGIDTVRLSVNLVTPGVSPPWQSQSIGAGAVPGDADGANRSFLIHGAGAGLGADADTFHFAFQPLSGRVQIQARLARMDDGFAGVMIRESLNPGAKNAFLGISSNQVVFGSRANVNGGTRTQSVSGVLPIWLRLFRYDNTVLAFQSYDATKWQLVSSVTLDLPNDVFVGLAVSSGSDSELSTALFEEVTVFPTPPNPDEPFCAPLVQWEERFGGTREDEGGQVRQLPDGGFVVGGSASSTGGDRTSPHYGARDFWLVRLDANGRKLWDQSYGGTWDDVLESVQILPDGGFILGGWSTSLADGNKASPNFGNSDFWVVRTDAAGNKLWDRSFGGSGVDTLKSLEVSSDGGFILAGASESPVGGNKSSPSYGLQDYWVVRLDSQGNALWDRSFGGPGHDVLSDAKQTADGGYILAGGSASGLGFGTKTSPNFGQEDCWVVRLDANGQRLWEKSYGGSTIDEGRSVFQSADGGFFVAGRSASGISGNKTSGHFGWFDYWVLRLDAGGGKIWEQTYGGGGNDDLRAMAPTSDGGLLLTGISWSPASGSKTSPPLGGNDSWVVRIGPAGSQLWDKSFGDDNDNHGQSAQATSDGGFILGGYTRYYDLFVIKLRRESPGDCDDDGVPDPIDLCPDTPLGAIPNSTGCSVGQLCPCESVDTQEDYVACVRARATEFHRAGLITSQQKHDLIQQASTTECPPFFGAKRGIAFGLLHTTINSGVLQFDTNGFSYLNVQSPENGQPYGVSIFLGEADSGLFVYPTAGEWGNYDPEWFMTGQAYGRIKGTEQDKLIATVRVTKPDYEVYPVEVDLSPLEPQSLTFQIFSNHTVIAEATTAGATGGIVVRSAPVVVPRGNPCWRMSDGSIGVLIEMMDTTEIFDEDPWPYFGISGPFGNGIRGNRVFIRANQPAKQALYCSRVDVLANIPFSIDDERLGMFAHAHKAFGPVLFDTTGGRLTIGRHARSQIGDSIGTLIEANGTRLEVDLKPLVLDTPESILQISAGGFDAALTHRDGTLLLEASSYSETRHMKVFRNGSLVGASPFSNNIATCTLSLKNNHIPAILGCSIFIESSNTVSLSISFKEVVDVTFPGAEPLRGNNLRITAVSSYPTTEIPQLILQLAGVDSFTITGERSELSPPAVRIAASADNIVLTWPDNTRLFTVEATPSLTTPFTASTNEIDFVEDQNTLTLPLDSPARFFRLTSPR